MSDTTNLPQLHGGEVWTQKKFPCFSCYLVFIGKDQWLRIHRPDERGNIAMVSRKPDGTALGPISGHDELAEHLVRLGYEREGQFSEILSRQREETYQRLTGEPVRMPPFTSTE